MVIARSTPLLTWEGTASLHSRQIAQWRLVITTDMYSCSPMDMHARLRNCLGRAHVSCNSRHYSRRSCCQDRRRSIRQRLITRRNTTQLEKSASGPLQVHLGLDMELWYPSGLPASNCNPSVFQQARNGWPSKVLYWCVQSSTSTSGHCLRRSPVLREDQLV